MRVMILGAAGMIGRKLVERMARDGGIAGTAVDHLLLADVIEPPEPDGFSVPVETVATDLSAPGAAERLLSSRPDLVFHLAAIVSGEAEADLPKGYRVNLDGTRALLDAIRAEHERDPSWCPRVVYSSSLAVFGGALPDEIDDDFAPTPQTSYGTQKLMGELLLADYSRRGILRGVGIRLPTIVVRPGKPNRAASGFYSGIIREPLAGLPAVLPVPDTLRHWMTSPRSAVGFLLHAATLDQAALDGRPNLTMPGVSVTVAEQIEALREIAGDKAVALIRREPDPAVLDLVSGWAQRFAPRRAAALGFTAEQHFIDMVRAHVADDLGGRIG
ncbi:MAG: SDR family oxidoreductase [Gluconacetobacter diazotrophicus]|nr:SDR family oxidoreductase [Gluconacetobacter diazotrophicus]